MDSPLSACYNAKERVFYGNERIFEIQMAKLRFLCAASAIVCAALLTGCAGNNQKASVPVETASAVPTATLQAVEEILLEEVTPTPRPTAIPTPTATPEPTPSPTPTPEPTPTPTPEMLGLLDPSYRDKFSKDVVIDTESEYRDATRSITVTRVKDETRTGKTLVYFVADIWIQDVESLRRAQARDNFRLGATQKITTLSKNHNAILAVSGDYRDRDDKAYIVVDGEVLHDAKRYRFDLCVLYRDGVMEVYSPKEIDVQKIQERGPWQTWNFGPNLLDENGEPLTKFNLPDTIGGRNPRSVIGYYEPGHYCLVLVDGRQKGYSMGLSIEETAQLMKELGCKAAYNLDGGISAQMTWHDQLVNSPGGSRSIRDIIYIPYPDAQPVSSPESAAPDETLVPDETPVTSETPEPEAEPVSEETETPSGTEDNDL